MSNCSVSMPQSEFAERLISCAETGRRPVKVTIELGFGCNLRCEHCYCPPGSSGESVLSTAEVCGVVDEIAGLGCITAILTGGEPLLRRDFFEIFRYIKGKGIVAGLFSNGTLVTEMHIDFFREFPPASIELSMYGASREVYDRVTGTAGGYDKFLRGFEALVSAGLNVSLKSVATVDNYAEIVKMAAFAEAHGVGFHFDCMIMARLDGDPAPLKKRLSAEAIVALDRDGPGDRGQMWRSTFERTSQAHGRERVAGALFGCSGGINSAVIDPYGVMHICPLYRAQGYSIRRGSFGEGFYDHFPRVREQKRECCIECHGCNLRAICGNCAAQSYLENGNRESVHEFMCAIAKARKAAFCE